ncbi:unnamed protein product [Amoebophrya sp. A25]|nr:unnamed protein product [Amoebophrya sp. A25]|eukprot:GSA25T00009908001.1
MFTTYPFTIFTPFRSETIGFAVAHAMTVYFRLNLDVLNRLREPSKAAPGKKSLASTSSAAALSSPGGSGVTSSRTTLDFPGSPASGAPNNQKRLQTSPTASSPLNSPKTLQVSSPQHGAPIGDSSITNTGTDSLPPPFEVADTRRIHTVKIVAGGGGVSAVSRSFVRRASASEGGEDGYE